MHGYIVPFVDIKVFITVGINVHNNQTNNNLLLICGMMGLICCLSVTEMLIASCLHADDAVA